MLSPDSKWPGLGVAPITCSSRRVGLRLGRLTWAFPAVPYATHRRLAYSLQSIDYSNNPGMTGRIPAAMGLLEGLQTARLQNTSLSCSGITQPYTVTTNASCSDPARCKTPRRFGDVEAQQHLCSEEQQLPCFLRFSDDELPREDASNMRCK